MSDGYCEHCKLDLGSSYSHESWCPFSNDGKPAAMSLAERLDDLEARVEELEAELGR